MTTVVLAVGLVLVVEGLFYALAPALVEDMLAALQRMPVETRRLVGLAALAVGVLLLAIARMLGA